MRLGMVLLAAPWLAAIPVARAEVVRLFELRMYHVMPGKLPVMEARFRDTTSKLLAQHDLHVVGYWATADSSTAETTFVFLLAHPSREEAKRNWDAMDHDPAFQAVKQAERTEKTLSRAEVYYLRPTDFSQLK